MLDAVLRSSISLEDSAMVAEMHEGRAVEICDVIREPKV